MILYMKYDVETNDTTLFEGSLGTQGYCLNYPVPNGTQVTIEDSMIVKREVSLPCIEGDVIDFFIGVAPSYEEAYLFDEYNIFAFREGKFKEVDKPECIVCSKCGKLVSTLIESMCEECFVKDKLPKELSSIYEGLGEDYTSYEEPSKIKDFLMELEGKNFYMKGIYRINEEVGNYVKKLLNKAGLEETLWTEFMKIC